MFPDIHLSESLSIPTYLVYLSVLYCFLIFYVHHRARKFKRPAKVTLDLAFIIMVMGFIGGRLLHVFFEAHFYYNEDWMRVLYFWQGGFVFYGGFLTALISCLLYLRGRDWLRWADFYAPVIALGYGLGRISCFLAGCCYGKSCDLPWAVVFPWDFHAIARHPVQLYMTGWELLVFADLIWLERRNKKPGKVFFTWLFLHGLGRLVFEQFRDDFRGEFIASLSLSTWISVSFIILAVIGLLTGPRSARK